jgi:hypothetical protein
MERVINSEDLEVVRVEVWYRRRGNPSRVWSMDIDAEHSNVTAIRWSTKGMDTDEWRQADGCSDIRPRGVARDPRTLLGPEHSPGARNLCYWDGSVWRCPEEDN